MATFEDGHDADQAIWRPAQHENGDGYHCHAYQLGHVQFLAHLEMATFSNEKLSASKEPES